MTRRPVDLAAHINETAHRGHQADFPVALRSLHYSTEDSLEDVPRRRAVVRGDTGAILAIVSDRYTLVPHQRILDIVEEAIRQYLESAAITDLDAADVAEGQSELLKELPRLPAWKSPGA